MHLLAIDDLRDRKGVPYSKSQIYRKIKEGSFPRPIRLGENRIAFLESEIDEWLKGRIAARDAV